MSNLKHVLGFAILLLPQSCGGHPIERSTALPQINAVIAKMHAVCASMGDKLRATNNDDIGNNDLEFACSDKDDVWYWIQWRDVK